MSESRPQNGRRDGIGTPGAGERRNGAERRMKPASGFTCISTVGWICRREQIRRKDDSDSFIDPDHNGAAHSTLESKR
jgi:hypothetical protein